MISLTSPVETRAHGWPAGWKLGALCLATILLFQFESLMFQAVICGLVLLLYALPGLPFLRSGLNRLRLLWPFALIILLWHAVFGGLEQGAVIVVRMGTAVGLANLVTMTTRLSEMIAVVHAITRPLRWLGWRTRVLEIAIALVVRFTPVLAQKGTALNMAWRARSARRGNWRILVPFTILAIDDAEHVAEALRARGGV